MDKDEGEYTASTSVVGTRSPAGPGFRCGLRTRSARSFARRVFLKDQMRDAETDLDAACTGNGELALVEEDLQRFDPRENSECIEMLRGLVLRAGLRMDRSGFGFEARQELRRLGLWDRLGEGAGEG